MQSDNQLSNRVKRLFLLLATMQAIHSVEEYAFGFTDQFPGSRFLESRLPGVARPGFVVFNLVLVCLAFLSYGVWIRRTRPLARILLWIWIAIELYNGIAHIVWFLIVREYIPGLVSGVLLLVTAATMAGLLFKGRSPGKVT